MKNPISFITFLIFLHCITNYMTNAEAKENDPVLDVDGNKLVEGDYYALMSLFRPGGGIFYYPLPNKNCTYGVFQLVLGDGLPVTFKLANSEQGGATIRESTDLNIESSISIGCAKSTVWKVSKRQGEESTKLVTTGGVAGEQGTENSSFQIRKAGDDYYKFVHCPRRLSLARAVTCSDVGISHQDGVRRLAVNGQTTFHVMFRRVQPNHEKY